MVTASSTLLIAELEGAVKGGTPERRVQMLRQVTDLFLSDADRLSETQIGVFDDVLVRLIERVETRALAQLSQTFSSIELAPREIVRQLAYHEEASVAVPVLGQSTRLAESDLMEIARTRGQQHLLAISGRESLNEALTDVLIARGDLGVSHALAKNAGARFSESGFASLVSKAERDDNLAEKLGVRLDIPANVLRQLLSKVSEAVRARLLKMASPEMRDKIQDVIQSIIETLGAKINKPVDYTQAQAAIAALNRAGNLNDSTVSRFARDRDLKTLIAAISMLAAAPIDAIEPLLSNPRPEGLIVACRAARLSWSTTIMALSARPDCPRASQQELAQGKEVFDTLSLSAAQRTIRFWSARGTARKPDAASTNGPLSFA